MFPNFILSNLINNKEVCTLCFQKSDAFFYCAEDNVCLDHKTEKFVTLKSMISVILREKDEQCLISEVICKNCAKSIICSYNFIQTCLETRKKLVAALEKLAFGIESISHDKEKANTLYLICNKNENNYKVYFDKYGPVKTKRKALKRILRVTKKKRKIKKCEPITQSELPDFLDNYDSDRELIDNTQSVCSLCERKFADNKGLRLHHLRVHAPKVHQCSKCPKSFGSETLLRNHETESHTTVICAECGKTYTNIHALKMHELSHTKLSCPNCGRMYKTRNSYRNHVKSESCSKAKSDVRRVNEKNYTCDVCSRSFTQKATLQVHINFEHENGKAYECTWCGKKFPAQSRLKSHIVKHTRERNFSCEICGGKFVTKEALLYHTRIHTGETPYACNLCDQKFLSASRRMDHIKRKHMGPTLECNLCGSKFRTPCSLRKHKKRHLNPNSRLYTLQTNSGTVEM